MKRFTAAALAAVFLTAAAGCACGGSGGGQPAGDQAANSDRLSTDVFFYDYSDTYIGSVRSSLEGLMKGERDTFSYTFYDGASDQSTQTEQIETAITRGSDLLVVNVVTTGSDEASQTIIQNASAQNVPVIFFNREVSDDIINSYDKCLFIGTDADEAGYMQGEMIARWLLSGDNAQRADLNGDKKIAYVMFRGELGNAEAYGRTRYSVENANLMLEQSGSEYCLVPSAANQYDQTQDDDGISRYYLYGNWSATTAKNLMDTALTTYSLSDGDIEMIIANNDDQALGAIEAMNELGYNSGDPAKTIPVFGVDATSVARQAIQAGNMTGTVEQDADGMAEAILHFSRNIAEGRDLMDGVENFHMDEDVAKIRISYSIYTADSAASGSDVSDSSARMFPDGDGIMSGRSGMDSTANGGSQSFIAGPAQQGGYANNGGRSGKEDGNNSEKNSIGSGMNGAANGGSGRSGQGSIGSSGNGSGSSGSGGQNGSGSGSGGGGSARDRIMSGQSPASNSGSGSGGGIYNAQ